MMRCLRHSAPLYGSGSYCCLCSGCSPASMRTRTRRLFAHISSSCPPILSYIPCLCPFPSLVWEEEERRRRALLPLAPWQLNRLHKPIDDALGRPIAFCSDDSLSSLASAGLHSLSLYLYTHSIYTVYRARVGIQDISQYVICCCCCLRRQICIRMPTMNKYQIEFQTSSCLSTGWNATQKVNRNSI